MIGFAIFVVSGLLCLYLLGVIPGPSLQLNEGAGFGLIIITALISVAGLIAGLASALT